jgi:hypothetical protein
LFKWGKIEYQKFLEMINDHHKETGVNWEQFYKMTKNREFVINIVNNGHINLKNAFLFNCCNINWKMVYNIWIKELQSWFSENIILI